MIANRCKCAVGAPIVAGMGKCFACLAVAHRASPEDVLAAADRMAKLAGENAVINKNGHRLIKKLLAATTEADKEDVAKLISLAAIEAVEKDMLLERAAQEYRGLRQSAKAGNPS